MFNSVWDILQKPLFNVGGQGISIVSFFYFLIVVFISVVLARIIIRFLRKKVYSKMEIDKGAQGALVSPRKVRSSHRRHLNWPPDAGR